MAVSDLSQQLHRATSQGDPIAAFEDELDALVAGLYGITDEQLAEIRESYRELTKTDLREAREADNARDEGSEHVQGGGPGAEAIVAAMSGNGEMAAAEIAAAVGIDTAALRPVLRRLIDAGQVDRTGRGRGTRYRLIEGGEA